jgi:choline dehydrogenase-like flavoprotein
MYLDSRKIKTDPKVKFDICIVGAGAAGIAIAKEFLNTNKRICVIESGDFKFNKQNQALYQGEINGKDIPEDYLTRTRLRMFGGSTMHWQGYCRPMDAVDFKRKEWLPNYPGWPISRDSLKPYYDRACKLVEINPFFQQSPESKPFFDESIDIVSLPFHISPPTRFGTSFREELGKSKNIFVHLFANAREFLPTKNKNQIDKLRVVSVAKTEFHIQAEQFILCSGGIENARILLNSNSVISKGIGNYFDLVGRYFMTHFPMTGFGKAIITHSKVDEITQSIIKPTIHHLSLKEPLKQKEKLLNMSFHLHPGYKFKTPGRFAGKMRSVFPHFENLLQGSDKFRVFPILAIAEQSPDPNNRIELVAERDFTGSQKIRLNFKHSQTDMRNIRRSSRLFATEIGRHSLGRVQTAFVNDTEPVLSPDDHHMGSTRMHNNPKLGVVDQDCKVHTIKNLYIAGSSVFPSSGFANPTLTLLALSLRLSDHLKTKLKS